MSIQITLHETTFSGKSNGVDWKVDLAEIPEDRREAMVHGLIAQGITIICQRAKSGATPTERADGTTSNVQRIQDGTYTFGQGGGGARLDVVTKGWLAYFAKAGTKISGKAVNGTNIDKALDAYCRQVLIEQLGAEGVKGKMTQLLELNREPLLAAAESDQDTGQPGWFIEREKLAEALKLKAKSPKGFVIKSL